MINSFLSHEMEESESSNPNNILFKPRSVLVYNGSIGAVDNVDKTVKPYQSVRKSFKGYKKVFFNLIDIWMYNSFVIYTKITPRRKVPYKQFLKSVISEIHSCHPMERQPKGRPSSTNTPDDLTDLKECISPKDVSTRKEHQAIQTAYTAKITAIVNGRRLRSSANHATSDYAFKAMGRALNYITPKKT
jgi:hypothetical protein